MNTRPPVYEAGALPLSYEVRGELKTAFSQVLIIVKLNPELECLLRTSPTWVYHAFQLLERDLPVGVLVHCADRREGGFFHRVVCLGSADLTRGFIIKTLFSKITGRLPIHTNIISSSNIKFLWKRSRETRRRPKGARRRDSRNLIESNLHL